MDFSFIQITDHHLTAADSEFLRGFSTRHALRTVLRHIAHNAGTHVDFIVSTGDLVDIPSEASYQASLELLGVQNNLAEIPGPLHISAEGLQNLPMFVLPGNHDDRKNFYKYLFPQSQSASIMNAAFIHKGIQFICLDWGPESKSTAHPEMLEFLAQTIKMDSPSIIMMHHQLAKLESKWLDDFIADDTSRFWEIIAQKPVLGIFCGHVHATYESTVNGVPVFGLRSTAPQFVLQDEPLACLLPPHYRLVTIQNSTLTTQIFEVPL